MADWLIVQAKPRAEFAARDALTAPYRGCTVYLPLVLVIIVHAGRKSTVERPFLSRYLFVRDDGQGTRVINTAPGVSSLARLGECPLVARQRDIDAMRARENSKGYIDLPEPALPPGLRKNDPVRITDGPFVGLSAVFNKWLSSEQRVQIMVSIFGRRCTTSLELDQFEAA